MKTKTKSTFSVDSKQLKKFKQKCIALDLGYSEVIHKLIIGFLGNGRNGKT